MIVQSILRGNRLSYNVCVIAVCEQPSFRESAGQKHGRPRFGLSRRRPCSVSVASQAMDKTDVDYGIRGAIQTLTPSGKSGSVSGVIGSGIGWAVDGDVDEAVLLLLVHCWLFVVVFEVAAIPSPYP